MLFARSDPVILSVIVNGTLALFGQQKAMRRPINQTSLLNSAICYSNKFGHFVSTLVSNDQFITRTSRAHHHHNHRRRRRLVVSVAQIIRNAYYSSCNLNPHQNYGDLKLVLCQHTKIHNYMEITVFDHFKHFYFWHVANMKNNTLAFVILMFSVLKIHKHRRS